MVEYGNGISHGPAGQVSGGGGGHVDISGHGTDFGSSVGNAFNDAVNTFSAMPLAEQVLIVVIGLIIVGFVLRKVF